MPVALDIKAPQLPQLIKMLGQFKTNMPRALSRSINRALNKGRTTVRREIRKEYLIKQKDIPIKVVGATTTRLDGQIIIKQGMLDLSLFKINPRTVQRRKNKVPIRAQVRVGGGGPIYSAFMLPPDVYVRKGTARLPIKKLVTISAAIMASRPEVGKAVQEDTGATLEKELDRQIKLLMEPAGGHS